MVVREQGTTVVERGCKSVSVRGPPTGRGSFGLRALLPSLYNRKAPLYFCVWHYLIRVSHKCTFDSANPTASRKATGMHSGVMC